MASGASSGGGYGLFGWIAGGIAATAIGIGGLYFTGYLAPDPAPGPDASQTAPTGAPAPEQAAPLAETAKPAEPAEPAQITPGTPEQQPDQTTSAEPAPAQDEVAPAPAPQADTAEPAPDLSAPRFDVVRVDPEGNTVIAGSGTPFARVTIFLDGREQAKTLVDQSGAFVSLLTVPASDTARVLSMIAELDGALVQSDDQIILAPTPRAETEPEIETATGPVPDVAPDQQVVRAETAATEPATPPAESRLAQVDQEATAPTRPGSGETPIKPVQEQATEGEPVQTTTEPQTADPAAQTPAPVESGAEVVAQASEPEPDQAPVQVPAVTPEAQVATETPVTPTPGAEGVAKSEPEPVAEAAVEIAALEPAPDKAPASVPVVPADTVTEPVAKAEPQATPEAAAPVTEETTAETTPQTTAQEPAPASETIARANPDSTPQTPTTTPPEPAPTPAPQPAPNAQTAVVTPPAPAPTPAPVTVLRAGKEGVEVLQPARPELAPKDRIALDTISYSEAGQVQLSGRAQARSVVRVYLDNRVVADMETDAQGRWSGQIEGIEPGIYTLRLDELGAVGEVLSRLETPFKREAPEVLNPPQEPAVLAQDDTSGQAPAPVPAPLVRAVTVQRGDTLWAISRERYGEGILYVRVFEANRGDIRDPDLIYPGQVFTLPE